MSDQLFKRKQKATKDLQRQLAKQAAEILVVCEGETEGDYIRHLRQLWGIEGKIHLIDASQHVCIKQFVEVKKSPPNIGDVKYGSSAVNVVNYAIAIAHKRKTPFKPYKQIFCLFDKDDPIKFAEANQPSKPIRGGEIVKITSIPCIEYWLLLHFERTNAPLRTVNCTIAKLKKYITDYSGDRKRINPQRFQLLCDNNGIDKASKWAQELSKQTKQLNTDDPTTQMFKLMNAIKPKKIT